MSDNFASVFRYLRNRQGLSQSQIAKKLGVTPALVGLWEQGRRSPSREVEETIADFFNVSLNFLRGKPDDELSDDEVKLLESYRKLTPSQRELVYRMIAYSTAFKGLNNGN